MILELSALGTHWWISLEEGASEDLAHKIPEIIMEFENNYSRFDDTSYISKLNDTKQLKNPPIELVNMLKYALDVYDATEGIFNISVGSKLEKSGYGYKKDVASKVSRKLRDDLIIDDSEIKLSKHTRIDLGGFGKGWLIEKLAGYLKNEGVYDYVINGGGDIAAGNYDSTIYIEHPLDSKKHIGEVVLKNNALASSSNIKRSWIVNGKDNAHIINPKGKSNIDILSMHVLADNILFADTFATILMLVNHNKRLELAEKFNLEFMEILPDLSVHKTKGFKINLNQ